MRLGGGVKSSRRGVVMGTKMEAPRVLSFGICEPDEDDDVVVGVAVVAVAGDGLAGTSIPGSLTD